MNLGRNLSVKIVSLMVKQRWFYQIVAFISKRLSISFKVRLLFHLHYSDKKGRFYLKKKRSMSISLSGTSNSYSIKGGRFSLLDDKAGLEFVMMKCKIFVPRIFVFENTTTFKKKYSLGLSVVLQKATQTSWKS